MGMNQIIFVVLLIVLIFMLSKNVKMYKRIKLNKQYVNIFGEMFNSGRDEEAYTTISKYVAETENVEFKNKGRIFKLFFELRDGYDYHETLNQLDFKELFYEKDKVEMQKIIFNSDTFIWVVALLAKARKCDAQDLIDEVMNKIDVYQDILHNYVEYTMCKSVQKSLKKEDDLGNTFLRDLINGDYTEYKYDKRLIGFYKKIAAAFLAYNGEELSDFEKDDVKLFATSIVGKSVLSDLDLYEEYQPVLQVDAKEDENAEADEETLDGEKIVDDEKNEELKTEEVEISDDKNVEMSTESESKEEKEEE